MKTTHFCLGILAITTFLLGCSPDSQLKELVSGKAPAPAAGASSNPNSSQGNSSGSAVVPGTGDLLLHLDMETAPMNYRYKGEGVEQKGVTSLAAGRLGAAWQFDGQGSFVQIPLDINPAKYPALTFTAWARYDGPESGGPFQVISHDDGGYDRSLGIDYRGADGVGWSTFAGSAAVLGSVPLKAGEWVFLASVYDQTQKTTTLYVNGVRKVAENAELGGGHAYLQVGANPSHGEHFTGLIDEVRVYGRALNPTEIESLRSQAN